MTADAVASDEGDQAPTSPILRWVGSKRSSIPILLPLVRGYPGRYIEPFAGSACLFFALGPSTALLGDVNDELIATYRTVARHPDKVARALHSLPTDPAFYYELRARDRPTDPIAVATRFVYLNRFSFNAIYRVNRKGEFNVPRGSRTGALPTRTAFIRAGAMLRRAELVRGDFEELTHRARRGDVVYMDPPFPSDRPTYGEYGYKGQFQAFDVSRLKQELASLDRRGVGFVLSFRPGSPDLDALDWPRTTVSVRRSVAAQVSARRRSTEILLTNRPGKRA